MPARLIDGKSLAALVRASLGGAVASLAARGVRPGLAAVLVGDDPASRVYVRNKVLACEGTGLRSELHEFPEDASEGRVLDCLAALNADSRVHGILVQLPLPKGFDAERVLEAVSPAKDVDGFHAASLGALVRGRPGFVPGTPAGILRMLEHAAVPIAGAHAVIVGRSTIVGKPTALLLLQRDATVTICHSKTPDLPAVCREADILVAAIGRAAMITADYIRPGATVIDVGMNRIDSRDEAARIYRGSAEKLAAFDRKGSVLVGDVHPLDVGGRAAAYTPVPGGVGPLTIAMLMVNTVGSRERRPAVC